MSENNNQVIITEAELVGPEPYDFEFIASTLGLIPYQALDMNNQTAYHGALNPGAIINLEVTEEDYLAVTLHGGEEIVMDKAHATLFEKTLKRKIEEANAKQREAMLQMQGGVPPGMIVGAPTSRRFRQ